MNTSSTPFAMELGGKYRTRAGDSVTIRSIDSDGMFFGDIIDNQGRHVRIASFSYGGRYIKNRETEFDIVSAA